MSSIEVVEQGVVDESTLEVTLHNREQHTGLLREYDPDGFVITDPNQQTWYFRYGEYANEVKEVREVGERAWLVTETNIYRVVAGSEKGARAKHLEEDHEYVGTEACIIEPVEGGR